VTRRAADRPVGRGSAPRFPSAVDWTRWGVDPSWSRVVAAVGHDGATRDVHVLDRAADHAVPSLGTVVCVHGNPSWSYLWRSFLRNLPSGYRVVAIDQLGMGYSERTEPRTYATRVRDLDDIITGLAITEPVILAGHDWGGAMVMGWAVAHADRVRAMVLCNTGIAIPAGTTGPSVIRFASRMTGFIGQRTRAFVDGTLALGRGRIDPIARQAFRAPYRRAEHRHAIGEFVADAPFGPSHPSAGAIADVAVQLSSLRCPVLLAFGANDPVFGDRFADDLATRLPQADRHRFPLANHLVIEEADVASVVDRWLNDRVASISEQPVVDSANTATPSSYRPIWDALIARSNDSEVAYLDGATRSSITFRDLHRRVERLAVGLRAEGLKPGDRVAVLVPPSVELVLAVYGVWRAGGVAVIADRGLGLAGLGRAVRSGRVGWMIGNRKALTAAKALRWASDARAFDVRNLDRLECDGVAPIEPEPDHEAAVLFTSGATGPAKGVRYSHRALAAQRDALAATYCISSDDRLVAAFAPFALYGPALGISSATPNCDVTQPGTLTATALADACRELKATMAFGSPAALANVRKTMAGVASLPLLRVVMSAGAPVPAETLTALQPFAPNATFHTPYGMTEALPVCDIRLPDILRAASEQASGPTAGGVCVGPPVPGAEILIVPLGFDSTVPVEPLVTGETGEILVRSPWLSSGYDRLWLTEAAARPTDAVGRTWHRSGDVGHIDSAGRLWVEGRSVHVIYSADGVRTPVAIERSVETALGSGRAAAVGVGPMGAQVVVIVIEQAGSSDGLAASDVTTRVRAAVAPMAIAAVLERKTLPVDVRHNAKIDRTAVASWATEVLSGGGS
jgi:olefin beta-lactone synthetase